MVIKEEPLPEVSEEEKIAEEIFTGKEEAAEVIEEILKEETKEAETTEELFKKKEEAPEGLLEEVEKDLFKKEEEATEGLLEETKEGIFEDTTRDVTEKLVEEKVEQVGVSDDWLSDIEKELDEDTEGTEEGEGEFQTIKCPKCGFKNKSDAWYCESCGTELITPE